MVHSAAAGKQSAGSDSHVTVLIAVMKKNECPRSLESLPTVKAASHQDILKDCFKSETAIRACAIDIVHAF